MARTATMMIHEAWTLAAGNATALRQTADVLDKITRYAILASYARTGLPADTASAQCEEECADKCMTRIKQQ